MFRIKTVHSERKYSDGYQQLRKREFLLNGHGVSIQGEESLGYHAELWSVSLN